MNHENWQAWSRHLSRQVVTITARVGMETYSRGADANAVMKLAEERLKSERPPDNTDHFSDELARGAFGGSSWWTGREL